MRVEEGRFHRQERIQWWEQDVLAAARVLVVGAGALGNEILKNLALLGVGNLLVVDVDRIELSNLSRSVLFREGDLGRPKAEVAARGVRELYPDARVRWIAGDVRELGLGVFHWARIVICGLDNVEARLAVNRACWRTSRPWIDGGIEALDGQMRMFVPPHGPCYECTLSEADWRNVNARRSCAQLSREEMLAGRVPTVATVSSVVAGLQCQEAVKWLHGRSDMAGRGVFFSAASNELLPVRYVRRRECYAHEVYGEVRPLGSGAAGCRAGDLLQRARALLGPEAVVELGREVLESFECPVCGNREARWVALATVTEGDAVCPDCGRTRVPHVLLQIDEGCGHLDRPLSELGVPPLEILAARAGERETAFLLDGDYEEVLGGLAHDG